MGTPVKRRRQLERAFYRSDARHEIDRLRAVDQPRVERDELARACGVTDEKFLAVLGAGCGLRPETFAALVLVPVVAVAWADGELSASERGAILDAAEQFEIQRGSPAFNLLGQWLDYKSTRVMREAWTEYVRCLCEQLGPDERRDFAEHMLRHARRVARATRGSLGFGPKTSRCERRVLGELASAFEE